jgi:hypothetical protein
MSTMALHHALHEKSACKDWLAFVQAYGFLVLDGTKPSRLRASAEQAALVLRKDEQKYIDLPPRPFSSQDEPIMVYIRLII